MTVEVSLEPLDGDEMTGNAIAWIRDYLQHARTPSEPPWDD